MKINQIKKIVNNYINLPIIDFDIEKSIYNKKDGRKIFNKTIRENVDKKPGVYVLVDKSTGEIVYIGMAGTIKTDGTIRNHSLRERLTATRGKDKISQKDVTTNDYVYNFMHKSKRKCLTLYIMYSKPQEPASYIEALILYKYFKKNKKLPILNYSF